MASIFIEECRRFMLECKNLPPDNAKVVFREKLEAFAHKCNIDPEQLYKMYYEWLKKGER